MGPLRDTVILAMGLIILSAAANAMEQAAPSPSDTPKSYSYFATGVERINYGETITLGGAKLKTDTTTENVVLLSGGRTYVNARLSFSINATSTLYPNRVTESWKLQNSIVGPDDTNNDGIADAGASKVYTPQTIQTNRFTYTQAATQFLLHYHPQGWWSVDGGMTYSLGTFKRFSFNYLAGVLVCDKGTGAVQNDCSGNTVVEETFGELSVHGGGSLNIPLPYNLMYRLSLQAGVPVISRIENTLYPDLVFDSTAGWNTELTTSLVYHFNENMNLGFVYDFQYQFKDQQGKVDPDTNAQVYIPENVRLAQRYGLVISWAF